MKILFASESEGWSGGAAQLLALALGLKERSHELIIASPSEGELARRAKDSGLRHIPFRPRKDYDLLSARGLAQRLCAEGIEVLHAHHPRAHAVALAALYFSSCRPLFVVTRRVSFPIPRNPFSHLKYANSRIDGFVAVAESIKGELVRSGVSPDKVRTIPSGVDEERFKPRPRDARIAQELGLPEGVPVVGKIANYGPWKGQDVFLDAAKCLIDEGLDAVFLLAGRDTQSQELRSRVRALGLESRVRLVGFRTDVPELLSLLDVSVNAATSGEGISGALRESLAMGIPVAASDAGGNAELVQDGVTGRLFKSGLPEDLARVIKETLENPTQARAQAAQGRRVVLERFSVRTMVEATEVYYRELAARRSKPPRASEPLERVV